MSVLTYPATVGSTAAPPANATVFPSKDDFVVFDGVARINTPSGYTNTLKGGTLFTISLWVYARDLSNSPVLFNADGTTANFGLIGELKAGGGAYFGCGGAFRTYNFALTENEWHHLVFVKTGLGDSGKLYCDGVEKTVTSGTLSNLPNENSDLLIGDYRSAGYELDGNVSDFRVYPGLAASSTQVAYLYTRGESGTDPTTDNLALHYKFDEREGIDIVDSAGTHDGTAVGITEPAFWNRGAKFDGVDDHIDFGVINLSTDVISLEVWVNPQQLLAQRPFVASDGGMWWLGVDNTATKARFLIYTGSNKIVDSSAPLVLDEWNHVVGTWSKASGVMSIYVNGVLSGTATNTDSRVFGGAVHIARNSTLRSKSTIATVRAYDDVLTADEVTYLYTAGASGTDPTNANLVWQPDLYVREGSTVTDLGSSGNDGVATDIEEPAFWRQPHALFDGTDDFITVPNSASIEFGGDVTFMWWMNPVSVGANHRYFSKRDGGGTQIEMYCSSTPDRLLTVYTGGTNGTSGINYLATKWHHYAIVIEATTVRFYRDGVEHSSAAITPMTASAVDLLIGKNHAGIGYIPASLSDMRMYATAVSAANILTVAEAGEDGTPVNEADLRLRLKFNDRYGDTVADSSGNGNDGTVSTGGNNLWTQE